jgi:hypothetical protein
MEHAVDMISMCLSCLWSKVWKLLLSKRGHQKQSLYSITATITTLILQNTTSRLWQQQLWLAWIENDIPALHEL